MNPPPAASPSLMPRSRARVLAALDHRASDSIPIDFGGHRSSGIAAMAYPKLRAVLGLPEAPVRVYDPIQQLAVIDEDVLDVLGVDTIEMGRGFDDACPWEEWVLPDGTPCLTPAWAVPVRYGGGWQLNSRGGRTLGRMPDGAAFFDQVWWPYFESGDLSPLEEALEECFWSVFASPPGPLAADPSRLAAGARALHARTGRAIIALFGGNLMELGQFLYRMDRFLEMLVSEPARAHRFLDRLTEFHARNLDRYLAAVGPYVDVVVFGDDLGGQNSPLISPRMYREFFKERHGFLWRRARQLAPVRVMLHCCGAVRSLIPDLIEAGLDAINPVQIACRSMDAGGLKRDFGDSLTFWGGGCDTQQILPFSTPAEIRRHVQSQIDELAPGGGFVFQQVHNILSNVPAANIAAMFAAVKDWSPEPARSGERSRERMSGAAQNGSGDLG